MRRLLSVAVSRRVAPRLLCDSRAFDLTPRRRVVVNVPATSANMGPGFDVLGMAVNIWNTLTVEVDDTPGAPPVTVTAEGEGAKDLPKDDSNLCVLALRRVFELAGAKIPKALRFAELNRVPFGRGLGSSSAAIVAGCVAGAALAGHEMPVFGAESLLQVAADIEGHPDNVAPALYGGVQIGVRAGGRWYTERLPVPVGMMCVVFVPDFCVETKSSRTKLPTELPVADAVHNYGRCAMLAHALHSGNLGLLRIAFDDRHHQPPRGAAQPHLYPLIQAATDAGAHGAYLSGSGPCVMAITSGASGDVFAQRAAERADHRVAQAMAAAARRMGVKGRAFVTTPAVMGAHVVSADPPYSDGNIVRWTVVPASP